MQLPSKYKCLASQVLVRSSPTPPFSKGEIKKEIAVVSKDTGNTGLPVFLTSCSQLVCVWVSKLLSSPYQRQVGHFNSPAKPLPLVEPITKNKAPLTSSKHLSPSSLLITAFSLCRRNRNLHSIVPLKTNWHTLGTEASTSCFQSSFSFHSTRIYISSLELTFF